MKRRLLQALGLSTAFFFEKYYAIMNPSGAFFLHADRPTRTVGWAILLDVLLGAAAFFLVIEGLRRTRYWGAAKLVIGAGMVWTFLFLHPVLLGPWLMRVAAFFANVLHSPVLLRMFALKGRLLLLVGMVLLFWLLQRYARPGYDAIMKAGSLGLMAMGIFAFISFYYFARAILYVPPTPQLAAWHAAPGEDVSARPRVVWVIFDELSEQQLFDKRVAGLMLPNFDRLRNESTVYTDARPIGFWTEYVIPSLIQGEVYHKYLPLPNGRYRFLRARDQQWVPLEPDKSVFALAQQQGRNAAIAGWYNNYCGLYDGYVQSCYWTVGSSGSGPMLNANTVGQNMLAAVEWSFRTGLNRNLMRATIRDDRDLMEHGMALLKNDNVDLVFLHLPPPHAPHVYVRATGQMTDKPGSNYADGLANADRMLGKILDTLKADPRWAQTTLIVQGDHSWRVGLWKPDAGWTAEDEAMAAGGFDDRPALMIRAPGQTEGVTVTDPISLMKVHDVIVSALQSGQQGK